MQKHNHSIFRLKPSEIFRELKDTIIRTGKIPGGRGLCFGVYKVLRRHYYTKDFYNTEQKCYKYINLFKPNPDYDFRSIYFWPTKYINSRLWALEFLILMAEDDGN